MPECLARFNRPRPVAWFFFLLGLGLCVTAGTWQIERLQWKRGLIAALAAAKEKPPLTRLPTEIEALENLQFQPVTLRGHWRSNTEFHLTPRYFHNQFGYWVISPFTLTDGRTLLVNRGWVPGKLKLLQTRPETGVRGVATLNGIVRVGAERGYFTPPSQPEKNIWFGRDIAQMGESAKLKNLVPVMVDRVGTQDVKQLPVPSDGTIRLRNDHLSYVITWYGIALGILVIFMMYHRKKA